MQQLTEFAINHWILVTAFCVLLGILAANLMTAAVGVTPLAAVALINRAGAVVIDVRGVQEFADGHVVDAVHVPLAELKGAADKLKKHAGKPLLVCCANGNVAAQGVRELKVLGFANVHALRGGISAWRADNLPLAKG